MSAVYRKELRTYFTTVTGCVFIAFLLLIVGIYSTAYNFNMLYPTFETALQTIMFIFLLIVPILTMRSLSEEKHSKTDQLLYSLPLSMKSVIIGKYLAMITVLLIPVVLMCFIPLILSIYGTVAFGPTYISIFAFYLLGCSLIAIGMFISSLTESQVIAAVLSFAALLVIYLMNGLVGLIPTTAIANFIAFTAVVIIIAIVCYFMTRNSIVAYAVAIILQAGLFAVYLVKSSVFEGLFADVINAISLFNRLDNFIGGMFDLSSIIYYISVIFLFVFFTVQSMEKKRWA